MPNILNQDIDFPEMLQKIKENHERYLRENMVTYVEMTGGMKQANLIKKYSENIGFYRSSKERYLNNAIQQVSLGQKAEHCALAVLLGIGISGATFVKIKGMNSSPLAAINPMESAKEVAGAAFSSVLGAGATYLIYQAWRKSAEKPVADDMEHFQAALNRAGFTNKKYDSLSAELVKLFHYRECILLNLTDGFGVYFRDEFLSRFSSNNEPISSRTLNIAIETYFLDELNKLFNKSFKDIYVIQEEEITGEIEQVRILRWLKHFFESPESRFTFTQQLQIHFMEECLSFLETEMVKPTFVARHSWISSGLMGLIAGCLALTLACPVLGCPLGISVASIALITACCTAALSYWSLNHLDYFKYQRDKKNRSAIKQTIENVTKECLRLNRFIKNSVETSSQDIEALNKYKDHGFLNGFVKLFTCFNSKEIAMGSSLAWLREYASRYRHSKGIEIDLAQQHQDIIAKGDAQTKKLQGKLIDLMTGKLRTSKTFNNYLQNSREYLLNKKNSEFISKFELIEKIKQQVLEIVAVLPQACSKALPGSLLRFYTDPPALGGLGGLQEDLIKVRELGSLIIGQTAPDMFHPYKKLIDCARELNYKLSQNKNFPILFAGDTDFRELLGLGIYKQCNELEFNISSATIGKYLENSYNFMYSLNPPNPKSLDLPMENSNEFVLYRMLLFKQLAKLADPKNLRVGAAVRRDIHQFILERFNIEPQKVFDDVVNQTLFVSRKKNGPSIQDLSNKVHLVNDLEWVADAIRVDLAYSSKVITPRMLIDRAASEFLLKDSNKKILFSYEGSENYLVPESTQLYFNQLKETISSSNAFIAYLKGKFVIQDTGILDLYKLACLYEVENLLKEIQSYTAMLAKNEKNFNPNFLNDSYAVLKDFKQELLHSLPLSKRPLALTPTAELKMDAQDEKRGFGKHSLRLFKTREKEQALDTKSVMAKIEA